MKEIIFINICVGQNLWGKITIDSFGRDNG